MQAERARALARELERVRRRQRSASRGGVRRRVGQHRQHERLGVPERVAVVARPGQPLGGDRPLLAAGARLQRVEQPEADRLLQLGVAVDLDVGALPEVVEVGALLGEQPVPAACARPGQRRGDLVADRRRASARADQP